MNTWAGPRPCARLFAAAVAAFVAFVVVEQRVAPPLIHIAEMRSRYAWPLIAATILCFASFMVVLSYIIPSIAENDASASRRWANDGVTVHHSRRAGPPHHGTTDRAARCPDRLR